MAFFGLRPSSAHWTAKRSIRRLNGCLSALKKRSVSSPPVISSFPKKSPSQGATGGNAVAVVPAGLRRHLHSGATGHTLPPSIITSPTWISSETALETRVISRIGERPPIVSLASSWTVAPSGRSAMR